MEDTSIFIIWGLIFFFFLNYYFLKADKLNLCVRMFFFFNLKIQKTLSNHVELAFYHCLRNC